MEEGEGRRKGRKKGQEEGKRGKRRGGKRERKGLHSLPLLRNHGSAPGQNLESLGYIFVADRMGPSSFKFSCWARRMCFETKCRMALQGHPRSLI